MVEGEGARSASDLLVGLGVVAALPTAVSGLSDLSDVVKDEDRSLGVAHAIGNILAVSLYAASFIQRRRGRRTAGKALSMAGAAVVTGGAYLGGHLVYRQVVGPSQAALDRPVEEWTAVLEEGSLSERDPKRVNVGGTDILLYRSGDRIYALANRCSHRGGPLHKGEVSDGRATCPWHLSMFDLADGSVVRGPATAPQPAYDVRVRNGQIEVRSRR
jgi:nitrite reductase/ring-hydroxylating ferredoxin subunit